MAGAAASSASIYSVASAWLRKDLFGLERHRAKTLDGLLTRRAAKMAAYTCGQLFNAQLGRPLRHLADLLL